MSHRITAFQELEITNFNPDPYSKQENTIYEILNAQNHNGGCSGRGTTQYFNQDELMDALNKLPSGDEYETERNFLKECIKHGEGLYIRFS